MAASYTFKTSDIGKVMIDKRDPDNEREIIHVNKKKNFCCAGMESKRFSGAQFAEFCKFL